MTPHPRWKAYVLSASVASEFNWIFAASPRPGRFEESEACFIVRDANGQALAYVYFEDEPGRSARRHTRMTTTTLETANQLPSWGIPRGSAEYLLFKTRFGTVGEPNEVICQSQQDRLCLGVAVLAIMHASAARSRQ